MPSAPVTRSNRRGAVRRNATPTPESSCSMAVIVSSKTNPASSAALWLSTVDKSDRVTSTPRDGSEFSGNRAIRRPPSSRSDT
ncbi:hypothetical protein AOZ06_25685 [Kibdelosporangium phytohabitans]|uniref:Uncharacterized protein n=1 Tax=Kibdelosporangium phytohabitans TaxID=860235 RepID=A0A0N9HX40_9PSEU|nr:hypothetical protein AOZ06_25685 [Kibdelosporangium phytohabitans]